MSGRERIRRAMHFELPDRVPVMCQLSIGHLNLHGGYKPHRIWFDTDAFADATVKLARRYRFDGVLVVLPGRPRGYLDRVASIREDSEGEHIVWRNGDRTFLPWDDMPHHWPADPNRPQRADFERFDPERDMASVDSFLGHIWNALYHLQETPDKDLAPLRPGQVPRYLLGALERVKAAVGEELSVHGSAYSPLTHFFELFGYEAALLGLKTDPGKAHAVLERLAEGVIAWSLALIEHGADAIDLSSAFVAAPFLSRRLYEDFVVPHERRVTEAVRRAGGIIYTHTCGRIADRLDLMEATGTQGIDTLDPPPLGNCDLAAAKRQVGGRLFLKGNINSVELLHYRTPEQVRAEVLRALRAGMPGGGYILSTACSVAPHVEPWKLEMLVPLAEEFGRYV